MTGQSRRLEWERWRARPNLGNVFGARLWKWPSVEAVTN